MAGFTLAQAQQKLSAWMDAEAGLTVSQSYTITAGDSSRSLTRAALPEVRTNIQYWQAQVQRLSRTRPRTRYFVYGGNN